MFSQSLLVTPASHITRQVFALERADLNISRFTLYGILVFLVFRQRAFCGRHCTSVGQTGRDYVEETERKALAHSGHGQIVRRWS
jgi:hypothetical protein